MTARGTGLLLHPTSLPGRFGVGDFGPDVDRFLDWAAAGGQTTWQVLPLTSTDFVNSPYGGLSAFAGNPLLLSPELLHERGLVTREALLDGPEVPEGRVDYDAVTTWKRELFRASWRRFDRERHRDELQAFREAPEQADWLADWALYAALVVRHEGAIWTSWDRALARREAAALESARRELADEVDYQVFLQWLFFEQWARVRREANARGIRILGDVPIYVSLASADVWAHQELFQLDEDGRPTAVAGVPPDYFSETGQLWGNPLYRWDHAKKEGYAWWISRVRANLRLADGVRLDHFRGFAGYWEVPAGESTAIRGRWVDGPGIALFDALADALGEVDIVAEDLGSITEDVVVLLEETGFPGMKVLQFGFYETDSPALPHNAVPRSVIYTGTHDNDTACGWFANLTEEEKERVRDYTGRGLTEPAWDLIRLAYGSVAERVIVPVQDVLGLGSEARMNTPGRADGNWAWRLRAGELRAGLAARLRRLAELTGRALPPKEVVEAPGDHSGDAAEPADR